MCWPVFDDRQTVVSVLADVYFAKPFSYNHEEE